MNSYTILNQTYFGIKLFDTPGDMQLLTPYFYDAQLNAVEKPIVESVCHKQPDKVVEKTVDKEVEKLIEKAVVIPQVVPISEKSEPVRKQKWFDPKQSDTLFWCIFTAAFGVSEYMLIGTKYANREWVEKQAAIVSFQTSSSELRATNHKITLGKVQEIMSEYMTSSLSLLGVVGLSVYYKLRIYLVDATKNTHLVYTPENYVETCYIYRHETLKGKYRLSLEPVSLDDSFCLESFTRPLRAVSTYKTGELQEIAERFGIDIKGKKDEVYRKISEHIVWL